MRYFLTLLANSKTCYCTFNSNEIIVLNKNSSDSMTIVWRVIPCVAKGLAEGRIVALDTFGNIPYNVKKKKIPETSH